ncbi:MAG: PAS domain S-box protein, partial [Anaerolineae bacterium]
MSTPLNVLILEDEPSDVDLVLYELRRAGFNPHWQRVETAVEFTNHLSDEPDLILADYSLPQFDALSALKILQENDLDIPFIVVTGSLEEMALECMKQGADDYLLKGHLPRLGPAVQYALRQKQMRVQKQQADQALRESEARYRLLFENNLAAVFRTTLNGRILDCNQAYADILGYSSRSEIQTHSAQAFYPETSDRSDFLQTLQAQKAVRNYEMQLRRKDGRLIWVVENVSLLEGEQGEPVIQGTLMDITAAKQTEAALRASERRFRALVENSSDAVALLDTEGAIRYVTPSISRILGYEVQEFVGRPAFDLLDPPTREYLLQGAFARFLKEPAKSELAEYRVRHKNGSWRWIENIVTNLLDDPDVAAVVCNFRDITDRKRREREREALLTVASVLRTATTRKEMLPALLEQLSDLLD